MASAFDVRPLDAGTWPALEDLFGRAGASNGCWCMYWRLGPGYRDRPRDDNRQDLCDLASSGAPVGLLAFQDDVALGWANLAPRSDLTWLTQVTWLAPIDDLPVWAIPCFFVRRSHRQRGVMGALVGAAVDMAREMGAPALEAYPIDTDVPGATTNTFPGIASVFVRQGFEEVARPRPERPIVRKYLA